MFQDLLDIAWVIPLIAAASFVLILFFGKKLPKKGAEVGIIALGLCWVLAVGVNIGWFQHVNDAEHKHEEVAAQEHEAGEHPADEATSTAESDGEHATEAEGQHATESEGEHATESEEAHHFEVEPIRHEVTWLESGDLEFKAGMLLDGMGAMMLFVVTSISLLVHIFSTDYVGGDRRYTHYFAFLSLFTASMLGLIMASSTVQLITMWELVGVCSFVLIGHWWEEKVNSDAALKAFLTNRVGDIGLLIGVSILFFAGGHTFDIVEINSLANSGGIDHTVLLAASCCLIAAVMSKSGQFILHTWLPDAMAGPTPVSALIHAATMVVAGIFMVGRMYGVFWNGLTIGGSSINLLAVVGGVTIIGGAGLAFVQSDIKKVLAYSTVSQLGYMAMALGVGGWTAAMFHLFTHAFFKAGLFLGSGSVAHAVHSFDMKKDMGGMKKFMPKTWLTFMICTGALIGIFPLAGFWSKDEILASAHGLGGEGHYQAFMVVGMIGAFMTAAYMTRCVYLTFYGEFRGGHHDAGEHEEADAHDSHEHADTHGEPHESGPRILVPLYILSFMAVIAGLANYPFSKPFGDGFKLRFEHFYEPKAAYFPGLEQSFHHPKFFVVIVVVSGALGFLGMGLAGLWYWRNLGPHGITERSRVARAGHTVLVEKYYFDHLYTNIIAGGVKGPIARGANWFNQNVLDGIVNGTASTTAKTGRWVYKYIDQGVVDTIVNGSGASAEGGGEVFRQLQTGKVQQYAAIFLAATTILATVFIIVI